METVHLLITGKVQGVYFRESSRKIAEKLNITGWMKNTTDQKVEALISGNEYEVKEFIDWCKSGPERAKVNEVTVSKKQEIPFDKFEIIRSR